MIIIYKQYYRRDTTMPRKTKSAQSRIKNLGFNAQKRPSRTVTMMEVEDNEEIPSQENHDDDDSALSKSALEKDKQKISSDEGFQVVFEEKDGSLTLVGFLNGFED